MADIKRELALLLTGKDVSASKAIRGVKKQVQSLGGIGKKAGANLLRNMERALLLTGTAAVGAFGYSVKAAADFEAQLNTINTVAQATPEALGKIGDGIREISRETGATTEDLTAAYYDLVSAGISAADAQSVLRSATTLAIGGLSTNAEAVDLLTTAINTYGGDASKAAQIADELAVAIERGKVTAADLAASYAQVGPLAASLNIENKELAAGYARLTAGGTAAGEAATQMASAMTALLKKTPGLKKLEKQTGKNYKAIAGSKGLNVALQEMRDDADDAGIELINLVGRKEALLYILQTTGENLEEYNADLAATGDAAGTAARQMGERQKGLNHQVALLKANLHDAAITIGTEVLPEFVELGKEAVGWLQSHQGDIKQFAKDLAAGIRDAVKAAKELDWASIGSSLQLAGQGAKAVLDVFMGMPDWVKAAVLTGWGLNKVTGGAVFDLGKLVLSGLRGATPATAMWVKVVGGMPGAGGKGGGGGGGGFFGPGVLGALGLLQLLGLGVEPRNKPPKTNHIPGPAVGSWTQAKVDALVAQTKETARQGYVSTSHAQAMVDQQRRQLEEQRAGERAITGSVERTSSAGARAAAMHADRLARKADVGFAAQRSGERMVGSKIDANATAARLAGVAAAIANAVSATRIIAALYATRPVINISATTVTSTSSRQQRYGRTSGSRGSGRTAQ